MNKMHAVFKFFNMFKTGRNNQTIINYLAFANIGPTDLTDEADDTLFSIGAIKLCM